MASGRAGPTKRRDFHGVRESYPDPVFGRGKIATARAGRSGPE